jgi:hypothetical protein
MTSLLFHLNGWLSPMNGDPPYTGERLDGVRIAGEIGDAWSSHFNEGPSADVLCRHRIDARDVGVRRRESGGANIGYHDLDHVLWRNPN